MPHKITDESIGVVISLSGVVRADEIFELNKKLMSEQSFLEWRYQIWDFSNAERFEGSLDHLRTFAIQDSDAASINPNQRIAIIPRKSPRSFIDIPFTF